MDLLERTLFFVIGGGFGFILGFICARLGAIKEELDEVKEEIHEVDEIVKHSRDGDGFVRYPFVLDVALLLVIVITVWAAFSSQHASNELEETQKDLEQITACNQVVLSQAVSALNERSEYSQNQIRANVQLQKDQAKFFRILLRESNNDAAEIDAAERYLSSLDNFVVASSRAVDFKPYPTETAIHECLKRTRGSNDE